MLLSIALGNFMYRMRRFNRRHPFLAFAVGTTIGFPLEHFLYNHVWPFVVIAHWLGLQ